jgi:hypothetical protein
MAEILKPVVPANAILRVDFSRNLLFVAGTKEELAIVFPGSAGGHLYAKGWWFAR